MKSIKQALLGLFGITGVALSMMGLFKVPFAESAAKDHWRHALAAIILILLLIAGLVGLLIYAFDANYFKAQMIQYVKVHKQRDLVLEGDIKVRFFPKLGLNSGKMSLSERNSNKEFASIDNVRLYIDWFPLIRKQLEIDRITLDGVHANVIRYKNGSTNFDDLLLQDGRLESAKFDIDGVSLTNSSINLRDETEGMHVVLHDLNMETGRLTDSIPSNVTANFRMEADKPHISAQVKLNSHLFFERKTGHYELANFEGEMAGTADHINNLALRFGGTLNGFPATGLLTLDKLIVTAQGTLNTHAVEAVLDLPKLLLDKNKLSGEKLNFNATLSQAEESVKLALQIPAFAFDNKIFQSTDLAADLDLKQAERVLQVKLNSPLYADLATRQLQLSAIAAKLVLNHPALSAQLAGKATGSLAIDFAEQGVNLNYVAKVDDTEIAGSVLAKNFQHPAYTFDIGINTLDVDRYLKTDWQQKFFAADTAPFNFAGLKELNLRGTLRAGEMKFAKIRLGKLSADIVADQSSLQIEPINANLYGGTLSASLVLSAQDAPKFMLKQKLANVQINQLLNAATGEAKLTGKANLALELHAQGDSSNAWRKALAGNISLGLGRGSVAGINLASALAEGKSLLGMQGGEHNLTAQFSETTDFSELKTVFAIKDGVAHGVELQLKSPLFVCKGSGDITLDSGKLEYRLDSTIASGLKRKNHGELAEMSGINIPVRVSGTYSAPAFTLNFGEASGGNSAKLIKTNLAKTAAANTTEKPVSH
jgi:AsmA protein